MFTVEMEDFEIEVVTLDESGRFGDVALFLDNSDVVYIRQWNEKYEKFELLEMSWQQLRDIQAAMDSPAGAYYLERKYK